MFAWSHEPNMPAQPGPELPTSAGFAASLAIGILVIDDNDQVRRLLQIALEQEGFRVWLAVDGRDGVVRYIRNAPDIDLVLVDVHMPGPDGLEIVQVLRQLNSEIRCCLMSGLHPANLGLDRRPWDQIPFIVKPFSVAQMTTTLRRIAHAGRSSPRKDDPDSCRPSLILP